jgi:hypothetical protein
MYTDLVKNHIKKAMTLAEVEELVGTTDLVKYCMHKDIKCMKYSMGTCYSGYTMAHGWLVVCFDKSYKVVSVGRSGNSNEYETWTCDKHLISCGPKSCICCFKERILQYQVAVDCPFHLDRW